MTIGRELGVASTRDDDDDVASSLDTGRGMTLPEAARVGPGARVRAGRRSGVVDRPARAAVDDDANMVAYA